MMCRGADAEMHQRCRSAEWVQMCAAKVVLKSEITKKLK